MKKDKLKTFGLCFGIVRQGNYFHPRIGAVVLKDDDKIIYAGEFASGIPHLANIVLTAQGGSSDRDLKEPHVYCWEICYDRTVNTENVAEINKSLGKIGKQMKKIAAEDGPPDSFGRQAIRFARAVGASYFIFLSDMSEFGYYRKLEPALAMGRINNLIDDTLREMGYTVAA